MSDQDIDKLFKEGLSGANMPFDESAWAGAEKAIIAHETAKRRRGIIFWFLAGLLLISGGLGIFQLNSSKELANNMPSETKYESQITPLETLDSKVRTEDQTTENMKVPQQERPTDPNNVLPDSESGNFKSSYGNPNDGRIEKKPLIVALDEKYEPKKEIHDYEELDNSNMASDEFLANSLAIRFAEQFEIGSTDSYTKSAGSAGELALPEHWDTKVNLIAGTMPLDYGNSENELNRLPYYAGIGISKIHNYSWEFGLALLYEELIYSTNEKVIEQVEYGFGKTINRHSINRQRGSYISIPIYSKYRIKNNHALMTGLQYSRLMQSYSAYTVETESNFMSGTSVNEQQNISGFNNDLHKNQISLILGYDLTLNDRLRLQVLGRLGANSLYKKGLIKDSFSDRIDLRIGIEYSLWRL